MTKPALPQGTRDFSGTVVRNRNYIFQTIRSVFECYGFEPLETPAMENIETLTGKYGDEGDKLIFKVLNNGLERPEKHEAAKSGFEKLLTGKMDKSLTERALRYDLTIPFARFIAMNHTKLTLPFKRYQIQPVWRADRPQRGRYREFYQCDADVVGSNALLNDAELAGIYLQVFSRLGININIQINNRKILMGLAETIGATEKLTAITVAIDKLDKIGIEKVKTELADSGLTTDQIIAIENYLSISGNNAEKLNRLKTLFANSEHGLKGIEEMEAVLNYVSLLPGADSVVTDLTLARGLNYYTGTIYEVKATDVSMGSIGGGGRYDNLTALFGLDNMPGVGISFGVDRIYDVMEELQLFPPQTTTKNAMLFFNLGAEESICAFGFVQQLRNENICCELYHTSTKMDKQFKYAEKKGMDRVVIIGTNEMNERVAVVKNLVTGKQEKIAFEHLIKHLSNPIHEA